MGAILDASEAKPYLVKIMPGVYDIGTQQLVMKEFVDVAGAGENSTSIVGSVSGGYGLPSALVAGANNSALSDLRLENSGAGNATAFMNNYACTTLSRVTAVASGGTNAIGISHYASTCTMRDVSVTVTGEGALGVQNVYGVLAAANVKVNASATGSANGVHLYSGQLTLNDGDISISENGGTGIYLQFNGPNSLISNVTINATGTAGADGIVYGAADATLRDVAIAVSGQGQNRGIFNLGNGTNYNLPKWTNVFVTASGGTTSFGIYNHNSSPAMQNVSSRASGAVNGNYGMYNVSSSTQTIQANHSIFEGSTHSVFNEQGDLHLRVGASQFVGPAGGVGEITCASSYDGSYAALDPTCR